jgi:hypothetical protein
VLALAEFGAAADRLDRYRLDHQLLARSMKPKRALWPFSKADFILARVPASTTSGVSVPA